MTLVTSTTTRASPLQNTTPQFLTRKKKRKEEEKKGTKTKTTAQDFTKTP
jgi:hypothetical protein